MNPKELISQIKDYANIADASYAMLDLKNKENNHARIQQIQRSEIFHQN